MSRDFLTQLNVVMVAAIAFANDVEEGKLRDITGTARKVAACARKATAEAMSADAIEHIVDSTNEPIEKNAVKLWKHFIRHYKELKKAIIVLDMKAYSNHPVYAKYEELLQAMEDMNSFTR